MILGLIVGLLAGVSLGLLLMGLLAAGSRADDEMEREFRRVVNARAGLGIHRGDWS